MASSSSSVRMYHLPSTSAGDAKVRAPMSFVWSRSNSGPARSTNVTPSSLVKNTLPSTSTGEAENPSRTARPRRACHSTSPVAARKQVTMLTMSLMV